MARIAGVDLPPQKRIWVGLTSIYGIGQPRARSLCTKAESPAVSTHVLTGRPDRRKISCMWCNP